MQRRDFIKGGVLIATFGQLLPSLAETGGGLTETEIATVLRMHNDERALFSVKPLRWSSKLASKAQAWAQKLAKSGEFRHSNMKYGENLAGAPNIEQAIGFWLSEKKLYKPGSRFRDLEYAHYTQMIWKKSKKMGCGKASGPHYDIFVCLYDPPGNFTGKKPY